jgi:hypothetical protein
MVQIVESVVNTLTHFIDAHGPMVMIGAVALGVVSFALWVLRRVALGRGS